MKQKKLRIKHKKDYPDYKYQPKRWKTSKLNSEESCVGEKTQKKSKKNNRKFDAKPKTNAVEKSPEGEDGKIMLYEDRICSVLTPMSSTDDTQYFYGGAYVQRSCYSGVSDVNTTQSKFENNRL